MSIWSNSIIIKYRPSVTDLGWTADPSFLVYDAGTVLCSNSGTRSPYIKNYDGWAICVIVYNANASEYGGNWTWTYLISTVRNNSYNTAPENSNSLSLMLAEKTYLNRTWYCYCSVAYNQGWGGATDHQTGFPAYNWAGAQGGVVNGTPITQSTFERIMELANVRLV